MDVPTHFSLHGWKYKNISCCFPSWDYSLIGLIELPRLFLRVFFIVFSLMNRMAPWLGFPGGDSGKELACHCRRWKDLDSIPGLGRSPGGGHGNPFQYSCLENPMDRGTWRATVHGVSKSQTRLNDWAHTHVWSLDVRHWQGWQSPALINNAVLNVPHGIYPLDLGWILCKDGYSIGITWAEVCALKGGWRDFFGGPGAKTPCSQCRGPGFHP